VNCSLLYAATIRALPELQSELFSVERVPANDERHSELLEICGAPNIYHLASHTGCGCGWGYRGNDTEWDLLNLGSVDRLAGYLREQILSGPIALLSSRGDVVDREPAERAQLSLDVFLSKFQTWRVRSSASYATLVELTGS